MIEDVEWLDEHNCSTYNIHNFIGFMALILFSPVSLLIDLILSPFEIAYHFFNEWVINKR